MSKLNAWCDRFRFSWDMNADGVVTITDVSSWLEFSFLLPAKIAMFFLSDMPSLSTFFEISCETGTAWGGAIFSIIVWAWALERLTQYYKKYFL